jgi:dihydrofolate reductase
LRFGSSWHGRSDRRLFVSLDGYAAGEDVGPFFGFGGPELDAWLCEDLDQPQLIVMGRATYQALAAISMSATDVMLDYRPSANVGTGK